MNPVTLETIKLMLSMITSDKEMITAAMKKDAEKVIKNLMMPILKDSEEIYKSYSEIQL